MCLQLIETLVVERRHQLGISRLTLRIEYGECPLLLLTRCQTIAEGGPLQFQFLVGQGPLDLGGMRVALALLHPGDAREDSDWDVVVLLDKPKMSHYDRYAIACELWDKGFDIGEEINTLVYTKAQWNDAPPSLFKHYVIEEGIRL